MIIETERLFLREMKESDFDSERMNQRTGTQSRCLDRQVRCGNLDFNQRERLGLHGEMTILMALRFMIEKQKGAKSK